MAASFDMNNIHIEAERKITNLTEKYFLIPLHNLNSKFEPMKIVWLMDMIYPF